MLFASRRTSGENALAVPDQKQTSTKKQRPQFGMPPAKYNLTLQRKKWCWY
jgi:hypothetical protein